MPYHRLPHTIVKELASMATRTYNSFPHPDGINDTMSPANIVTSAPKPDFKTLPLEFGTYVQYDGTSSDTKSRSSPTQQETPAATISLCLWKPAIVFTAVLGISDAIISRVEILATQEGMPPVDHDVSINEYDPDEVIDESAYDRNYLPPVSDPLGNHNLTTDAYTSESDLEDDDFVIRLRSP
jgi:hypothetical protein